MRLITLITCLSALSLIVSCNSNETMVSNEPTFEIESNELFTIEERYDNGWIKSAIKSTVSGALEYEVTYHENGYLSTYKVYQPFSGNLEFEHSRDERNLPLSSIYYDLEGNLYANLEYSGGGLSSKEVTSADFTTFSTFKDGRIILQERIGADQTVVARMTYDYSSDSKTLTTFTADANYTLSSNISDQIATGYDYQDDFQLLNLVNGDYELLFNSISGSAASSIEEKNGITPIVSVGVTSLFYADINSEFVSQFGITTDAHNIKSTLNDDLFRSLREQYPFTEEVLFVGNSNFLDREYIGQTNFVFDDFLQEQKETYGDDFQSLFGTDFVNSYVTGLFVYYIGTLRNLPSDESLRSEIIDIARRQIDWITTGNNPLDEEDQALLDYVFFEFKVHSNSGLSDHGLIINDHDEYEIAVNQLDNTEMQVVQFQLYSYD